MYHKHHGLFVNLLLASMHGIVIPSMKCGKRGIDTNNEDRQMDRFFFVRLGVRG